MITNWKKPMMADWKKITGYEGLYEISSCGEVYSCYKNKTLKPSKNKLGYLIVNLYRDGKYKSYYVHRLVAEAFITKPENQESEVNHKDLDKTNNIVSNLEWVTHRDNLRHAVDSGVVMGCPGEKSHHAKLTNDEVIEIRNMFVSGVYKIATIADMFNVSYNVIYNIVMFQTYKDVKA